VLHEWYGAWIVLRKLILHYTDETRLEVLDLRKMRCIGLEEADESIRNLHGEKGSLMLIDCPPYTMYVIMSSPRDTKTWRLLIKETAHANGNTLKNQQLTKDNVQVLVDKCMNFFYTHGSMSEEI
jgi:Arf-GAP with Rho-GAP domain, ANK repeat and PH domain-containing protein 1